MFTASSDALWLPSSRVDAGWEIGPSPEFIAEPPPIQAGTIRYWQSDPDRFEAPGRRDDAIDAADRESPWGYPPCATALTQRLHHRSTLVEIRSQLGVDERHGTWIDDRDVLRALLETPPPCGDSWWVKAGFTTSGRHRVVVTAGGDPRPAMSLLDRSTAVVRTGVLVEPGRHRVADYGAVGWVGDTNGERRTIGPRVHRQTVTPGGQFGGLASRVDEHARERVSRTWTAVARLLHTEGYRGPFGIDAFEYRTSDDTTEWIDLCEVNARLTFGHVAHAWARRLGDSDDWRFHAGRESAPEGAAMLLPATEEDSTHAWLASLIH